MKVGDLVTVGTTPIAKTKEPFISIILAEEHRNKMHFLQVLKNGQAEWYPVGYIEVINESR